MKFAILVGALVCGCAPQVPADVPKQEPVFGLAVPAAQTEWKKELVRGFAAGANQFHLTFKVVEYAAETEDGIVGAISKIPKGFRTPMCVVFTNADIVMGVVHRARDDDREVITLGEDNAISGRIGHVGESSDSLAYLWSVRAFQRSPVPRHMLVIVGNVPVHRDRIKGALFARSDGWSKFELRMRSVEERPTAETIAWADVVTGIGEDAAAMARTLGKPFFSVDGSPTAIEAVRSSKEKMVLVPDFYQIGYRAARIAREYHITGSLSTSSVSMPYRQVDKGSLEWFERTRYDLPPAVPQKNRAG
jgi:hypothetical protein